MKLLLTSAGISNASIRNALTHMLGKPIQEAHALFIPTAIYAIEGGGHLSKKVICGTLGDPFCDAGWKSLGLLELTALPSLKKELWISTLEQADALLVGGGDCQYLCYWMQQSGLDKLLPELLRKTVYIGLSAGSMIMTRYGTTYGNHTLPDDSSKSLGFLNFAIHPHAEHEWFPENTFELIEKLASTLTVPSYAIDDNTAIMVDGDQLKVISEGKWKLFHPKSNHL